MNIGPNACLRVFSCQPQKAAKGGKKRVSAGFLYTHVIRTPYPPACTQNALIYGRGPRPGLFAAPGVNIFSPVPAPEIIRTVGNPARPGYAPKHPRKPPSPTRCI